MSRRKKVAKPRPTPGTKLGTGYEQVVAEVVGSMDPATTVVQGTWEMDPDGERDRDVVVSGTVDGVKHSVLIECKDYTRPVGIGVVDALESKRHDLAVDAALLCSNTGFTRQAISKAGRVGIGLFG